METDDPDLRAAIRARLQTGQLPLGSNHRLFGGQGDGSACACCDRSIAPSEIQFDVEYPVAGSTPVGLSMHLKCFTVWSEESSALAEQTVAVAGKDRSSDGPL